MRCVLLVAALTASVVCAEETLDTLAGPIGRPLGGAMSTATASTTQTARKVRAGLFSGIDARLADRIDQLGSVAQDALTGVVHAAVSDANKLAEDRLKQVDGIAAARLTQVDGIVAGRIAQVGLIGDALLGQVGGIVDGVVKGAGKEVRQVLWVANAVAKARITQLARELSNILTQVDGILAARLSQLDGIAKDILHEADEVLAARIEQADEVVGKRLGNVDIIVSKQLIAIEASVLKVLCVLALAVALMWIAVRTFNQYMDSKKRLRLVIGVGQAALVTLVVGVFYFFTLELPGGSNLRTRELRIQQSRAFRESLKRLDLTSARFHASQLAFLADTDTPFGVVKGLCHVAPDSMRNGFSSCGSPEDEPLTDAQANGALARVTLLRDVLVTPSALASEEGRQRTRDRISFLRKTNAMSDAQLELSKAEQPEDALAEMPKESDEKVARALARDEDAELTVLEEVLDFHGADDASKLAPLALRLASSCAASRPRSPTWPTFRELACETLSQLRGQLPSQAWRDAARVEVLTFPSDARELQPALREFTRQAGLAHVLFVDALLAECRAGAKVAAPAGKSVQQGGSGAAAVDDDWARTAATCAALGAGDGKTKLDHAAREAAATRLRDAWVKLLAVDAAELDDRRAELLWLDDAGLSLALAPPPSSGVIPKPLRLRELAEKQVSFPPRVSLVSEVFGGLPLGAQQLAAATESRRFLAYEALEYLVISERSKPARSASELVRFAKMLELKGMLDAAVAANWVDKGALASAFASQGVPSLPLRR